jgi:hypothetical protein
MVELIPEIQQFIAVACVVSIIPVLSIIVAALLMRTISTGFEPRTAGRHPSLGIPAPDKPMDLD